MKTICTTGYEFTELDATAKEKVIEWTTQYIPNGWEDDKEYWLEQLTDLGYSDIDFQYSGFYSQGDGGSIVCRVDVKKFIQRNKYGNRFRTLLNILKQEHYDAYVQLSRRSWGHYVHDNLLYTDDDEFLRRMDYYEEAEEGSPRYIAAVNQAEEIAPLILEEVREWSRKIYNSLEEDYDYHFTEEYVAETCEANEYLFSADGRPIHHLANA